MASPFISQPTPGDDTYLASPQPDTNYGAGASMIVGQFAGSKYHIALKFDFNSIPAGSECVDATLEMTMSTKLGTSGQTIRIYRAVRAWTTAGATWNKYDGANAWTTAGGTDHDDDRDATVVCDKALAGDEANGAKEFELDAAAIEAMLPGNGFTNNGFLMRHVNEATNQTYTFRPGNWTTAAERPKITISYTTGGGPVFRKTIYAFMI